MSFEGFCKFIAGLIVIALQVAIPIAILVILISLI